ncbi:MAG: hypothetical protein WAT39_25595 [Planctomycetota bacterium]
MFPHERSLVEEMKDKPFALIGVNSDKEVARAKKSVADNNLNWRSFHCGPQATRGPIPKAWAVKGWPTIVVLDAEFKIHYRGHDGDEATKVAKGLVEKMSAGK